MAMPMPADPQEQNQGDDQGSSAPNGAKELVSGINTHLMALLDLMNQSQGVDPQDKQQLEQIIQMYQKFVTENLGAPSQGGQAPEEMPQVGNVPLEARANPNARAM